MPPTLQLLSRLVDICCCRTAPEQAASAPLPAPVTAKVFSVQSKALGGSCNVAAAAARSLFNNPDKLDRFVPKTPKLKFRRIAILRSVFPPFGGCGSETSPSKQVLGNDSLNLDLMCDCCRTVSHNHQRRQARREAARLLTRTGPPG